MRSLGLFGGSFDPVHRAHLHAARSAAERFELDQVLFLPAAQSPLKEFQPRASENDRMAMLRLGVRELGFGQVSDFELQRGGTSYTIDTVRALPEHLDLAADCKLFWIMGADNLAHLEKWREVEELFSLTQPIVIARKSDAGRLERLEGLLSPELLQRLAAGFLDLPTVDLSSTELRLSLAKPSQELTEVDRERLGSDLPSGVREYIEARGIYRS